MTPYVRLEETGATVELPEGVTTVGRGPSVAIELDDASVSRLHAELVRHGPYVYVTDLASRNGTRVNGRPVGRRVLEEGDILNFGTARCSVGGLAPAEDETVELSRIAAPDLTRREMEVLHVLCRPAQQQDAFVNPASAKDIADELFVTEAAVKQHLLRLYAKFRIPEGTNRRSRLANAVVAAGVVRPTLDEDVRRAG